MNKSKFTIEKADAFVLMARCYAGLKQHRSAINSCMAAINLNPDFSEALRLAGDLTGDINRLKYQYLARRATNHGVLFIRKNNRIKVTLLSDYDWAGSGYRIVQEVRKASGGVIDIEAITYYPGQGSNFWSMQSGVPVHIIGQEVAQSRIDESDIIHYKDDHPYNGQFHELTTEGKKIVRLVSGSKFRNILGLGGNLDEYQCDFNAYATKDLHVRGWEYMPQPYTYFDYRWKPRRKFRIVHVPSDPEKKGTRMIQKAIELLNRPDLEFICEHNVSHDRSLELKSTASLYIDQMLLPPVANAAYEAIGFGVPVLSWTAGTDELVPSPKDRTPQALAEIIDEYLDWDELRCLSEWQFKEVQERCGKMGDKWIEVYRSLTK